MRITNHPILGSPSVKQIQFSFNNVTYNANEGESIAAALLANSIRTLRYSPKHNEPRGIYCGIGHCYDCIVDLEGFGEIRACITPVQEGMCLQSKKRGDRDED